MESRFEKLGDSGKVWLSTPQHRDIPKWMVENHGKPYFLIDDLGVTPSKINMEPKNHPIEIRKII